MVGVLCIGAVEVDYTGVVDIMVLGGVFVVDVVEGVELVVGCSDASPVVCKWKGIFFCVVLA